MAGPEHSSPKLTQDSRPPAENVDMVAPSGDLVVSGCKTSSRAAKFVIGGAGSEARENLRALRSKNEDDVESLCGELELEYDAHFDLLNHMPADKAVALANALRRHRFVSNILQCKANDEKDASTGSSSSTWRSSATRVATAGVSIHKQRTVSRGKVQRGTSLPPPRPSSARCGTLLEEEEDQESAPASGVSKRVLVGGGGAFTKVDKDPNNEGEQERRALQGPGGVHDTKEGAFRKFDKDPNTDSDQERFALQGTQREGSNVRVGGWLESLFGSLSPLADDPTPKLSPRKRGAIGVWQSHAADPKPPQTAAEFL